MADVDPNADTEELTPEVVTRDGGTRRDAGRDDADHDDAGREDAGEDAARSPLDDAIVLDPTDLEDAGVNPPVGAPPGAGDAGPAPLPAGDGGPVDPPPLTNTTTPCVAGPYVGTFSGELRALNGVVRIDVVGVMRFELPAAEGATLTLRAGTIEGKDADGHPMTATVSGVLDCTTGQLEGGRITAGTYTRPDPVFRSRTTTSRFSGVVTGSFTAGDRPTGKGTWNVDSDRSTRNGNGTFEVQLAR